MCNKVMKLWKTNANKILCRHLNCNHNPSKTTPMEVVTADLKRWELKRGTEPLWSSNENSETVPLMERWGWTLVSIGRGPPQRRGKHSILNAKAHHIFSLQDQSTQLSPEFSQLESRCVWLLAFRKSLRRRSVWLSWLAGEKAERKSGKPFNRHTRGEVDANDSATQLENAKKPWGPCEALCGQFLTRNWKFANFEIFPKLPPPDVWL